MTVLSIERLIGRPKSGLAIYILRHSTDWRLFSTALWMTLIPFSTAKNGKDVGGGGGTSMPECKYINLRVSFLPVKWSTLNFMNLWGSAVVEHSMKSSALFWMCTPLPYVHLMSTWYHSCAKCSLGFPLFLPLFHLCVLYWTQSKALKQQTNKQTKKQQNKKKT